MFNQFCVCEIQALSLVFNLFLFFQEYAGLGGNAKFFKSDVEFQANRSLILDSVSIIQR